MTTHKRNPAPKKATKPRVGKAVLTPKPTSLISAIRMETKKSGSQPASVAIKTPKQNDILFGRGGESNNNQGNRRYQKVIGSWSKPYSELKSRKAKTQLAWQIYNELRLEGVRFLKREKGSRFWCEAPEEECRKKISQRLRERALEAKDRRDQDEQSTQESASVAPSATTETTEESEEHDLFEDASIAEILADTDLSESDNDGSLESLMDFADDFPSSWMREPIHPIEVSSTSLAPQPLPVPVQSRPEPVNSYNAYLALMNWQQAIAIQNSHRMGV